MASLEHGPKLNPQIAATFSGMKKSVMDGFAKLSAPAEDKGDKFSMLGMLLLCAMLIGLIVYLLKASRLFENKVNIARMSKADMMAQTGYDTANPKRIGIRKYLQNLVASGVPDSHLVLTNFYVSTVNATGLFFPSVDGIVTPQAARMAVLGGARGFVFDLWPDMTPGANFAPCIQVVESGSLWRRVSMNSVPFAPIVKALMEEAFAVQERPGYEDPVFLYLRFRGTARAVTYAATASALRAAMEQYRMPVIYNNRRAQDRIFSTPITELFRKVIVCSNVTAEGNPLSDYINVGPRDGVKVEWNTSDVKGMTDDDKVKAIKQIKSNLSWVAPLSEDPNAEANSYDFVANQSIGIQFSAMNFWNNNDKLKAYMDPKMFGTQSFAIKPAPIRYVVEMLPPPKYPENPNWGTGTTAGTPTKPANVQLP